MIVQHHKRVVKTFVIGWLVCARGVSERESCTKIPIQGKEVCVC